MFTKLQKKKKEIYSYRERTRKLYFTRIVVSVQSKPNN